jgi:hypothetical protein
MPLAVGSETQMVMAQMKMKINDMFAGYIRPDGRMVYDMYLSESLPEE